MEEIITLDQILGEVETDPQKEAELKEKRAKNLKKRYEYIDVEAKMKLLLHESTLISQDDIFIENAEEYRCAICSQVFRDPVTDECDHQPHTFCNKCLARTLAIKKLCPISRKAMDNFKFCINQSMNKRVQALTCKCYYFEYGCNWTGVFKDLDKHVIDCPRMTYKCLKCDILLHRTEVDNHIATCEKRKIKCKMCRSWEGLIADQQEHDDGCPEWTVTCQYCSGYVVRKNFKLHLEKICQSYIVTCPFEDFGCTAKIGRGDVQKHIWENSQNHFEALYKATMSLINKIESRNLQDLMSDHSDDIMIRARKSVVLLKKKIMSMHEEVIKTNKLIEAHIHDRKKKGTQIPNFPLIPDQDFSSSIKNFLQNFGILQQFVNNDNEMTFKKEIIQTFEAKFSSVESELSVMLTKIADIKKANEEKLKILSELKSKTSEEQTNLNVFSLQYEDILKENQALQEEIRKKDIEIDRIKASVPTNSQNPKNSCCMIF